LSDKYGAGVTYAYGGQSAAHPGYGNFETSVESLWISTAALTGAAYPVNRWSMLQVNGVNVTMASGDYDFAAIALPDSAPASNCKHV
jgi:hypothetical protein